MSSDFVIFKLLVCLTAYRNSGYHGFANSMLAEPFFELVAERKFVYNSNKGMIALLPDIERKLLHKDVECRQCGNWR
ncbi:hypothetical protein D1872_50340 [compost metagenome]